MNIAVIGIGYVGLVTGTCFSELGNNVLCMDIDEAKIKGLKEGRVPFYEPELEEILKRNYSKGRLNFTTDINECVKYGDIIFITVGTPEGSDSNPDMHYLNSVINLVSDLLNEDKTIVIKSTVPVGTTRQIKTLIYRTLIKLNKNIKVEIVDNPEFLSEGTAVKDFMFPNRIVIGTDTNSKSEKLNELYKKFSDERVPIINTSYESSEMIKYASNAFLATKISYINEIASICEFYNADVTTVAEGMGFDERIGNSFLKAGAGYGGSCFPKDTKALVRIGAKAGHEPKIVKETIKINKRQKSIIISKIKNNLHGLETSTIGILGVAFKPETDDIREAPAGPVIEYLLSKKAKVKIYDPKAMDNFRTCYSGAEYCSNLYEACRNTDCIVLFTEWQEFLNIDFDYLKSIVRNPVFLDLRNMFKPQRIKDYGFTYEGIGTK